MARMDIMRKMSFTNCTQELPGGKWCHTPEYIRASGGSGRPEAPVVVGETRSFIERLPVTSKK